MATCAAPAISAPPSTPQMHPNATAFRRPNRSLVIPTDALPSQAPAWYMDTMAPRRAGLGQSKYVRNELSARLGVMMPESLHLNSDISSASPKILLGLMRGDVLSVEETAEA